MGKLGLEWWLELQLLQFLGLKWELGSQLGFESGQLEVRRLGLGELALFYGLGLLMQRFDC